MPSVTWGWFSLIQTTFLNKPSMTFCLLPPFLWFPVLSFVHLILLLLEGDPCSFLDALYVWYILFHDLFLRSSVPITFGEYSFSTASWLLRIAFIRQLLLVFASSSLLFFKTKKEKKKIKELASAQRKHSGKRMHAVLWFCILNRGLSSWWELPWPGLSLPKGPFPLKLFIKKVNWDYCIPSLYIGSKIFKLIVA